MESPPYYRPPLELHHSSRPTLGFPLGTALLLIVIFSLSGIFSCCYHWDKLRHLRGGSSLSQEDHQSDSKPKPTYSEKLQNENQSLPVVMPGDRIATFIALPCPCQPPRHDDEKVILEQVLDKAPKPPHIAVTLS